MNRFRTHKGEYVEGKRLQDALASVASDWRELAHAIYQDDAYASHVTQNEKDAIRAKHLAFADRIESGKESVGYTIWQRVNSKLTGECVALLA
jgi:hypothetical protein